MICGLIKQLCYISDGRSSSDTQRFFNVVHVKEKFNSGCFAFGDDQLRRLSQVGEKVDGLLPLCNLSSLFEYKSRSLLDHKRIDTFKRSKGCDISPPVSNSRCNQKSSTTTRLTHLVAANIDHLRGQRFYTSCQVVEKVKAFEFTLIKFSHCSYVQIFYTFCRQRHGEAI